jgi:hypothetical protein
MEHTPPIAHDRATGKTWKPERGKTGKGGNGPGTGNPFRRVVRLLEFPANMPVSRWRVANW